MKHLFLIVLLLAAPVWAVQPDEILGNPDLENRARAISKNLRCLVCRNENIDDSNAELARDLRLLVRERLVAGDTDQQAVAFIVDRYGEYVLLKPEFSWGNALLWAIGPLLFLIGAGFAFSLLRKRPRNSAPELSDQEKKRLAKILDQ